MVYLFQRGRRWFFYLGNIMRISLQPAFILHHRPYRETSLLLEVFTQDYGRIALVARGVRTQRSPWRALLQLFVPLLLSWQGKSELMTLTGAEAHGGRISLKKDCLLSGLYLNELLMRVLQKHDAHPQVYTNYSKTLLELHSGQLEQKILRLFEKKLLEELGYGLQLQQDVLGRPFIPEKNYRFHPEQGFALCDPGTGHFSGKSLLAFAAEELKDEEALRDAKRLMRMTFAPLLGERELQSRQLFLYREEVKNE